MLSQFQASYRRVEQSLQQLTDSIAAYNPSTKAANDLVAADDEVNANVAQLTIHQSNYARIQELRQTTDQLDATLRKTIQLLADSRKELLAIPSTDTAEDGRREVGVEELLAYAKFISKTTVPPTFRKHDVPAKFTKQEGVDAFLTNGISTPTSGAQELGKLQGADADNVGIKAMDAQARTFIDPLKDLPFEPWPSHEVIQRGALADIQRMIESGQDPGSVLNADQQAEADRRRQEEEEKEELMQEERERRRMSMFDSRPATMRKETAPEVFDPDEM